MEPVNILDARNRLSQLITAATNGEDVVIAKRGRPVVRLVPIATGAEHTGRELAAWLSATPIESTRTTADLDDQIARERAAWD